MVSIVYALVYCPVLKHGPRSLTYSQVKTLRCEVLSSIAKFRNRLRKTIPRMGMNRRKSTSSSMRGGGFITGCSPSTMVQCKIAIFWTWQFWNPIIFLRGLTKWSWVFVSEAQLTNQGDALPYDIAGSGKWKHTVRLVVSKTYIRNLNAQTLMVVVIRGRVVDFSWLTWTCPKSMGSANLGEVRRKFGVESAS